MSLIPSKNNSGVDFINNIHKFERPGRAYNHIWGIITLKYTWLLVIPNDRAVSICDLGTAFIAPLIVLEANAPKTIENDNIANKKPYVLWIHCGSELSGSFAAEQTRKSVPLQTESVISGHIILCLENSSIWSIVIGINKKNTISGIPLMILV